MSIWLQITDSLCLRNKNKTDASSTAADLISTVRSISQQLELKDGATTEFLSFIKSVVDTAVTKHGK